MMRTMKKTLCGLLACLMLAMSGCGGKTAAPAQQGDAGASMDNGTRETANANVNPDAGTAAEFTPALDPQTECAISIVGHYSNFESLENAFNRFARYYPNVELSYTALDSYNKTIALALAGDEAPDIFFVYPWMAGNEAYQTLFDAAEDLSDASLGIDLACIRQGILYTDAEGRVPYVPIFDSTYGMLVNEDIFEKENLSVPKTYSELLSACDALQKAGYPSPMMGYSGFLTYPLYFPYFCARIRGDETAIRELNSLQPSAGEHMRGALELAADFMSRGYVDLELCDQMEDDYKAVILRFFEGDVPMMLASGSTVSGTEKRESLSEAFTAHPFRYSLQPVPSTEEGGYFLDTVSMAFAVNKNSKELDMTNEFMRFLIRTEELNQMAREKRMVTPCIDMSLDAVYTSFGELEQDRIIYISYLGLDDAPDTQVRKAGNKVSTGKMTVDDAIAAFGSLD